MESIILTVLVLAGFGLVGLVLLQQGKGADAGAAFGGGGGGGGGGGASGTFFGSQGSGSFMTKSTGVLATIFFLSSLSLAYLSGQTGKQKSLLDDAVIEETAVSTQDEAKMPVTDQARDKPMEADMPSIPSDIPSNSVPADKTAN